MIHELKEWPPFFEAVKEGKKTFEVRKDDRGFKVGDELMLREYVPEGYFPEIREGYYTRHILQRRISYIMPGGAFGIKEGYVVLGLEKV